MAGDNRFLIDRTRKRIVFDISSTQPSFDEKKALTQTGKSVAGTLTISRAMHDTGVRGNSGPGIAVVTRDPSEYYREKW